MILVQASLSLFWLNLVLGLKLVPEKPLKSEINDFKIPNHPHHHSLVKRTTQLQEEGGGPSIIKLCESEPKRYAKIANTDSWYLVVNKAKVSTKIITVDVCKNPGAPCDNLDHSNKETVFKPRSSYGTRCEQIYHYKAIKEYNGQPIERWSQQRTNLPMYCACVFSNN